MIYVLKHKKTGKYIANAIGKISRQGRWDGDSKIVKFHLSDDLLMARQIEDPDMETVYAYGLEPVPIKLTQAKLERAYRIIEHE